MLKLLKNIFNILNKKQKYSLIGIQILVVLVGFLEVISITVLGYFVSLIAGIKNFNSNNFFFFITEFFFGKEVNNLFFVSSFLFFFLLFSSTLLIIANYLSTSFATKLGTQLAKNLYKYFLNKDILFYSQNNTSKLLKKINNDTEIVIDNFFIPLIQINAKIILLIVIIFFLFFINPLILISGFLFFFLIYYVVYKVIRLKIQKISLSSSIANEDRFKIVTESFSGIREIIMNNSFKTFVDIFDLKSEKISNYRIRIFFLINSTRYLIEFLALSSIIFLVMYFIKIKNDNFLTILPFLAIYALAIFRILPLFQQIYTLLSQIKVGVVSFLNLQDDFNFINLDKYKKLDFKVNLITSNSSFNSLKYGITLKNINFSYPNKKNLLKNINIFIPVKKITGIVGITGSGKSTLVDIISGLLHPNSGELLLDNNRLDINDLYQWRKMIGYVSQNIFLLDGTILDNIIFDLNNKNINLKKVEEAIKNSGLEKFINDLQFGLKTKVGQNGLQLSGGQRQRLSIARALYKDPEILILDEATSSLDVLTENFIVESIKNLFGLKTIILVAHRFSIIKNCNIIYYLNNGEISGQGSYDQLILNNKEFYNMTKIS